MSSGGSFFVPNEHVYRRPWTNWNGGAAGGGRITIHKSEADMVNIFIGLLVGFVMNSVWRLIAFAWSCFRDKVAKDARDPLFLRQQVLLRNEGSPLGVGYEFIKLQYEDRHSPRRRGRRLTWSTIIIAFVSAAVFLAALPPLLSMSLVDNQGIDVLIDSPHCGFWAAQADANEVTWITGMTNQSMEAMAYADSCYLNDEPSSLCDEHNVRRRLPKLAWTGGPCPFNESICLASEGSPESLPALIVQTEALDSHKHLGINSPPEGRVLLQRTTTCSPLAVSDYSSIVEGDLPMENETAVYFGKTGLHEHTFEVSHYKIKAGSHYTLKSFWSRQQNGSVFSEIFEPIPELRRPDADVSVIFLNNNLIAIGSQGKDGCRDPFFSATRPTSSTPGYFWPDHLITAIGCIDQYAFGNPVSKRWTKAAGLGDFLQPARAAEELGLSDRQFATLVTMVWALENAGGMGPLIKILGTEALLAKKFPGVLDSFQHSLPNDQWKKEVSYWVDIGLAKLQLELVRVANGPPDPTLPGLVNMLPVLSSGRSDIVRLVCSSQRVMNASFRNFHFAGLLAFLVVGLFLMILEHFIPTLAKVFGKGPGIAAWENRDLLEMHKQILDAGEKS